MYHVESARVLSIAANHQYHYHHPYKPTFFVVTQFLFTYSWCVYTDVHIVEFTRCRWQFSLLSLQMYVLLYIKIRPRFLVPQMGDAGGGGGGGRECQYTFQQYRFSILRCPHTYISVGKSHVWQFHLQYIIRAKST